MVVIIGTRDGIYRTAIVPAEDVEQVGGTVALAMMLMTLYVAAVYGKNKLGLR